MSLDGTLYALIRTRAPEIGNERDSIAMHLQRDTIPRYDEIARRPTQIVFAKFINSK